MAGVGMSGGSASARRGTGARPWGGEELARHELSAMFPDMAADVYAKLVESVREHGAMKPVVLLDGEVLDGWHRYRAYREAGVAFDVEDWDGAYGSPLAFVLAENELRRDLTPSQRAALAVEVKRRLGEEYKDRSVANLKYSGEAAKDRVATSCNSIRGPEESRVATNCQTGPGRLDEPPDDRVGITSNSASDGPGEASDPRFGTFFRTGANARREAAEALGVNHRYVDDAERIQQISPRVFAEVKRGEKTISQAKRELGLDRPRPAPDAPPAADGGGSGRGSSPARTIVNGEAAEDPEVERLRAAGVIPADAVVTVEDPGDAATDPEAVREEYEERRAILDADLGDEEWLATLPLSAKLTGVSLDVFRRDALLWRRMEPHRRLFAKAAARELKAARKGTGRSIRGKYAMRLEWHLSFEDPSRWLVCPPLDKGGCGGAGIVKMIGPCPMCRESGYIVPRQ